MTLKTSEILRRLALGELSTMKMAEAGDGTFSAAGLPIVLIHLNDALKTLYTKFLLSQKELIINTDETITHYYLREEFEASSGSSQPIKYIDASPWDGWDGRIGKVLKVYDAFGRELYMNKVQEPLSVFTPEYDCIQITANHQTEQFFAVIQALHPLVDYDTTPDPDTDTTITLPPGLEKPLVLLTASKVYGDKNGEQNLTKEALLHQKYESELLEAELRDTPSTSHNFSNSKLDRAGFV